MNLLELFEPYLSYISFFITILLNVWLISKKVDWIILLIGNLIIILIFQFFGLAEYNLLNKIVEWFLEFIGKILKGIWDNTLGGWLKALGRWLGFNPPDSGPTGPPGGPNWWPFG